MPVLTAPARSLQSASTAKKKIVYIDRLRVILTVLVILHHSFIAYGAPGSWYYTEKATSLWAILPMTLFVATNQSFFMGFFFFLSALFTEKSYRAKGPRLFLADRFKRLGIPLLFYSFVLSPLMNFMVYTIGKGHQVTLMQFLGGYDDWIDFGVLWFVAALLVFTLVYAAVQRFYPPIRYSKREVPSYRSVIVFGIIMGILSYVVRMLFPIGWTLKPVGFQLAYFPQYIALFCLGIVAARNNWLESFSFKRTLVLPLLMVFVAFPLLITLSILIKGPANAYAGHGTWQSLLTALWEQTTGFAIIACLLTVGREKWNRPTPLYSEMTRSAYAAYIIHPFFVITMSLLLKNMALSPIVKLAIAAPCAVALTFLAAALMVRLPVVNKIV